MNREQELTTAVQPEFINIQEAAKYTGYKVGTLYNLVHDKQIPFVKRLGKLSFSVKRLREWMEQGEQLPNNDTEKAPD